MEQCRLGFSSYLSAWDLGTTQTLYTTVCGISAYSFLNSHIRLRGRIFSFLPMNICAMTFLCALWSPVVNKERGFESQTRFADTSLDSISALLCKNEIKTFHGIQKVTINPTGNTKLSHRLYICKRSLGEWTEFLNSNCS